MQRLIAGGEFPGIDRLVHEAGETGPEQRFGFGPARVLDGVAARRT